VRAADGDAAAVRRGYAALLPLLAARPVDPPRDLGLDLWTFSCQRDLPEQVASLRSFLRHAGRPRRITVVSDGSHTPAARALLARLDPVVRVVDWDRVASPEVPRAVRTWADRGDGGAATAMVRKLAVELSMPVGGPTVYADADVLFFPGAADLADLAHRGGDGRPRYLPDCGAGYLDERLADPADPAPVNAGFFALHRPLDFSGALRRLARLGGPPRFHTEQTVLHLALHDSGGVALDRRRYVLSVADMHRRGDAFAADGIVLRHYTTPVRPKLWRAVAARARR